MTNMLPETDEASKMRKLRTEFNFRRKHGEEGLAELMEMADKCEDVRVAAERFKLSPSRISQIYLVLLGVPYNVWLSQHGIRRKRVTPRKEVE